MRFDENRKLAVIVLIVCILISVFALGGSALSRERGKVLKVFDQGADPTLDVRHSMDAYLDSAAECALIMANEGEVNLGQTPLTDAVGDAAAVLADDKAGLDARYDAYASIKVDIEKLYGDVEAETGEAGFRDFKLAYKDFKGYADMIERDEYHKLAKSYNSLISGFPGGVVAGITGNGVLNTFGG